MVFEFKIFMLSIWKIAISLFLLTALSALWLNSHFRLRKHHVLESSLFRIDYSLCCGRYYYLVLIASIAVFRSAQHILEKYHKKKKNLVLSSMCSQSQIQPSYEQRKRFGKYGGMQKSLYLIIWWWLLKNKIEIT